MIKTNSYKLIPSLLLFIANSSATYASIKGLKVSDRLNYNIEIQALNKEITNPQEPEKKPADTNKTKSEIKLISSIVKPYEHGAARGSSLDTLENGNLRLRRTNFPILELYTQLFYFLAEPANSLLLQKERVYLEGVKDERKYLNLDSLPKELFLTEHGMCHEVILPPNADIRSTEFNTVMIADLNAKLGLSARLEKRFHPVYFVTPTQELAEKSKALIRNEPDPTQKEQINLWNFARWCDVFYDHLPIILTDERIDAKNYYIADVTKRRPNNFKTIEEIMRDSGLEVHQTKKEIDCVIITEL